MAKKGGDTPAEPDLEGIRSFLREEAEQGPTGKLSTYEQVAALLPEIEALLNRRRTKVEVRDLLATKGLEMSLGTFDQYLRRARKEAGGEAENKPKAEPNRPPQEKTQPVSNPNPNTSGTTGLGPKNTTAHRLVNDA